jgi:PAS domain S-box-containing protein
MDGPTRLTNSTSDDGRYRLLVEAITDYAIYMLDPTGIVTSWNPGAERFKGYAPHEIIGQHFSRFYTDEDRATGLPARALETARREGKFEHEGWRVRKDGTRFWAYVVIDPIRTPAGEIVGFAKITRDLTERRAAEEALRASQEQFRLLVQGVTDYAIYMLDKDGRVTNWNLGAERIKGYTPHEIIGQHFSKFYTEEDRAAGMPEHALATALEDGRFEKEGWRVRKDGTRFFAHVIIDAIRDNVGKLLGFAKITRDITERRDAQQKLDQAREALSQSQKMEAIGQLTGGIAHDFNNLLMAVLGSLELVRKRVPDDPKILQLIDNATQGAQRGAALTKRMLAFARRQELKREAVDLPTLVRDMTDLLQRSLGPTVTIETRFPLALPAVWADANQLEMALLNLAVNARDAMPEGGTIIVSAHEEGNDDAAAVGGFVRICVSDTGVGMDEATLQRATEPFFTTKEPGKGTGLGLSMVHGLAQQSGGRFVLKSRTGEGSTAELWLPVARPGAATDVSEEEFARTDMTAARSALKVLAVDDDPLVLTNTAAMLEYLGHTCLRAASGAQALEILRRSGGVDVVVTDQVMPRMTGLQLAEAIARDWPQLPVLIATGYAEMEPGAGAGLSRLSKPFTQGELAAKLAQMRVGPTGRVIRLRGNGRE